MTRCAFEAGTNFLQRFIIVLSVKFQSTLKNIAIENLRWRFQMTGSPKHKEMEQASHLDALERDFPGNMINHRQNHSCFSFWKCVGDAAEQIIDSLFSRGISGVCLSIKSEKST